MRETASRTTRRTSPEGLRLGERLRQLRVAAGLTQSELAGDRFSKEYVSQIERGKTRPTEGTIEWLADRLGVDAGFLASGVATDERGRLEGALSRAEALYEAQEDAEAARRSSRSSPRRARPAFPSCRSGRSSAPGSRKMRTRRPSRRARAPERGARAHRVRVVLRRRAGRRPPPARRLPLPAQQHADRDRAVRRGARARRALRPAVRRAQGEHPLVALALLAPPARLRGGARRRRARARARAGSRRPPHDRRRVLPGFARRRPPGPLGARAEVRRARARGVRAARRSRPRRPAHEQPRRSQLPARQDRRGDRAAQGGVRDRARPAGTPTPAAPSRRSRRSISAPATWSRPRSRRGMRSTCSTDASTTSTRSEVHSSCSGAHCSSRVGSTRPRRRSPTPRRASPSSVPAAIARPLGSHAAISPLGAATTNARRSFTGQPPRRYRTSASKAGKEVTT